MIGGRDGGRKARRAVLAACGLVLGLAGGAVGAGEPVAPGMIETAAGLYMFMPDGCGIYQGDDGPDIEIGGTGVTADGEGFYFALSSTGNAVSIGFGADGPFASAERRLVAGRHVSEAFDLEVEGQVISAPRLVLVDDSSGAVVDDGARMRIDCGT